MEFLADEYCDHGLIEKLRQSGHDVIYFFESSRGAADDDVLTLAFNERRILCFTYRKPNLHNTRWTLRSNES